MHRTSKNAATATSSKAVTRFIIPLLLGCLLLGCQQAVLPEKITLEAINGETILFGALPEAKVQVYFYFGPTCPLSENYTAHANRLMEQYGQDSVRFTAIIPGHYDSPAAIADFITRFKLRLPVYRDSSWQLTRFMQARITPEVFVYAEKKLIYKGAIDNWAVSLGQQRRKATEHYLENALTAYFAGQWINPDHTEAVGCFIEPPQP